LAKARQNFNYSTIALLRRRQVTKTIRTRDQGCEAGTQISGSGFGVRYRHLTFLAGAPAPTSKSFWLRLQNYLVHGNCKTTVLFAQLACPTN